VLADEQRCVGCISAPAQRPVEQLLVLELWQERSNRFSDADFRRIWVCVYGMFRMRSRHRNALWCRCTIRRVHLEPRKPGKLVANLYYPMPTTSVSRATLTDTTRSILTRLARRRSRHLHYRRRVRFCTLPLPLA
jgi:hypothetical protein